MKSGLILENSDVKKIIAEHFNVDELQEYLVNR